MRIAEGADNTENWDRELKQIARDVNSCNNKSTGRAPYEVIYGYLPRFGEGQMRQLTQASETYEPAIRIQNEVREAIARAQQDYKSRYDTSRRVNVKYNIGDIVFVQTNPVATGESTKLQSRYKGPFVIVHVLPSDTYVIEKLTRKRNAKLRTTAHVSQLKIWRGSDLNSSDESDEDCSTTSDESDCEPQCEKFTDNFVNEVRESVTENEPSNLRRSTRQKKKPEYLKHYV